MDKVLHSATCWYKLNQLYVFVSISSLTLQWTPCYYLCYCPIIWPSSLSIQLMLIMKDEAISIDSWRKAITSLWMTQCCMTMYACAYVLVQGYGIFSMLTVGIPNPNYFIEMLLTLFRCIFVSQFCCLMRETTYFQFRTMCYELRNHLLPPLMSPLPRGWLCSLFYYAIFFENMNC